MDCKFETEKNNRFYFLIFFSFFPIFNIMLTAGRHRVWMITFYIMPRYGQVPLVKKRAEAMV